MTRSPSCFTFFFFNDPATTEIYTLSLHDALPISPPRAAFRGSQTTDSPASHGPGPRRAGRTSGRSASRWDRGRTRRTRRPRDRKSTRLNSSHLVISYAVFCLKKKKQHICTSYREL